MSRTREEMEEDAEVTAMREARSATMGLYAETEEHLETIDGRQREIQLERQKLNAKLRTLEPGSKEAVFLTGILDALAEEERDNLSIRASVQLMSKNAHVASKEIAAREREQRLKMASEHSGSDSDLSSGSGSPRSMSLSPPRRRSGDSPHSDSDLSGSDSSVELGELPSTPPQELAERQRIAREAALKEQREKAAAIVPKKSAKTVVLFSAPTTRREPPKRKVPVAPMKKPPSYVESLGFVEKDILAAMAVINGVPDVIARKIVVKPSTDVETGFIALEVAIKYAGNYSLQIPTSRRREIRAADDVVRAYFRKIRDLKLAEEAAKAKAAAVHRLFM